jgi:hypothetical protein
MTPDPQPFHADGALALTPPRVVRFPGMWICMLLPLLLLAGPATGETRHSELQGSVQFLYGQYTTGNTGESWNPLEAAHEDNFLLGGSCAQDFWELGSGFMLGAEAGAGLRFGSDPETLELWVGPRIRHRGFVIGNAVRFSFYCTTGISWVSGAMGSELVRVNRRGGDSEWLFYLGPDVAVSLTRFPKWELFYRLHHRSGANATLGGLTEGHNANTIGIRHKF